MCECSVTHVIASSEGAWKIASSLSLLAMTNGKFLFGVMEFTPSSKTEIAQPVPSEAKNLLSFFAMTNHCNVN